MRVRIALHTESRPRSAFIRHDRLADRNTRRREAIRCHNASCGAERPS
jgi:hypothetical protein